MSRPLNIKELQTLEYVLGFFDNLLKTAEINNPSEINKYYIEKIKKEIDSLSVILKKGKINVESSEIKELQSKSDIKGMHINDKQNIFSLTEDMQKEENIKSLWLIIAMLLHEKFHFERHTGIVRLIFKSPLELFIGSALLIFSTKVNKKTFRTLLWKEYQACVHSYLIMQKIGYLLVDVFRANPISIKYFDEHFKWHREAMERQNPWSSYGL